MPSSQTRFPMPPIGWELNTLTGTVRYTGQTLQHSEYGSACARLIEWAHRENMYLGIPEDTTWEPLDGLYGVTGPRTLEVDPDRDHADSPGLLFADAGCYSCGRTSAMFGTYACSYCGVGTFCNTCSRLTDNGRARCTNCIRPCERCGNGEAAYETFCRTCWNQRRWCEHCPNVYYTDDEGTGEIRGMNACPECMERACPDCHADFLSDMLGFCPTCGPGENFEPDPEFDYGVRHINARNFSFQRGAQLTSVEIEFNGDDEYVAQALRDAGLSRRSDTGGYHEGGEGTYVEYDGSLSSGGEMVISMLHLPAQSEAKRLYQSVDVLRGAINDGFARLTTEAGVHVHVDVSRYDLDWAMSAAVVYNYLESTLYHIAAAGWRRGHRSASSGNDYAKTTPKGISNPERFQSSFGADRYYGLNMSNYFYGRRRCRCGVGFENGSRCTCNVGKCTMEFRLWNTTANGTKILAYVAIPQAIAAFAKGKSLTAADLPYFEYGYEEQPTSYDANAHAERLQWMFENLPFSPEERNAIRYCIRNSGLGSLIEGSDLDEATKQGILHEDELLNLPDFIPHVEDADMLPDEPMEATLAFESYERDYDDGYDDADYDYDDEPCDCYECRMYRGEPPVGAWYDHNVARWRDADGTFIRVSRDVPIPERPIVWAFAGTL